MQKHFSRSLFIVVTLFLFQIGYSQSYVDSLMIETFNNNDNGWEENNDETSSSVIKDGKYNLEEKQPELPSFYLLQIQIDNTQDYFYETSLVATESTDNNGYGFIWGLSDWKNYNSFYISPNGYVTISSVIDGNTTDLKPWEFNIRVKPLKESNTLKVDQTGDNVTFFVNDKEVFNCKKNQLANQGNWFCYVLEHQKKVEVDYLKVKGKFSRINVIKDALKGYKKENLGQEVNSTCSDLGPIISADGNTLYFFRKNCSLNVGGVLDANDDAWYSEKDKDGNWGPAKNFGFPINNTGPNFIVAVSADNNTLFIANTYTSDGSPNAAGISYSNRTANGWSMPKDLVIENFENNNMYVNFFVSQDRKVILFGIETDDSFGGLDIYVSFLNENDTTYTEPKNLGNTINTKGLEMSPFLASDNQTLYFSSDTHAGYGSIDIFISKRLDDTWSNWSIPLNLGKDINTKTSDSYFTIPASGEVAYMASNANSMGYSDIVKLKLPTSAKPNPVVLVKGKVLNKNTKEPIAATVAYYDITSNKEIGTATSNPKTGEYSIILQSGKKYSFSADKENYYAINDFLDVTSLKNYKELNKDLLLVPIEVGQTIRLNNVFFDFNKANIKPDSELELQRLVEFLKDHTTIVIEISGHTDNQGADDYNLKLSQERVKSVLNYLISHGISKTRIVTKGYGKSKPLASNDTEEGRAHNRRVEFTILKK